MPSCHVCTSLLSSASVNSWSGAAGLVEGIGLAWVGDIPPPALLVPSGIPISESRIGPGVTTLATFATPSLTAVSAAASIRSAA